MAWDDSGNWHDEAERKQVKPEQAGRELAGPELSPLVEAFRDQLLACLEECARGRLGLFSDREHLDREASSENERPWPEAAQLRHLAFALQAILAQQEQLDKLCDQFLDLCSIHGESDPGEPRLARAFLNEIAGGRA
jgi:hypothetical protein